MKYKDKETSEEVDIGADDSEEQDEEFSFAGQGPNEDVLVIMQRHPLVLFKPCLIISLALIRTLEIGM